MFKFDFDIDENEDEELNFGLNSIKLDDAKKTSTTASVPKLEPFTEIPLQQLLDALPSLISYSPLTIPLSSSEKATTFVRRDLFDARFQLISEGAGDAPEDAVNKDAKDQDVESSSDRQALAFLDAPSDLVPGVYEGGLKTWECSLDLVDYLDSVKGSITFIGKRMLEIGCGTGIPSMYLFREILSSVRANDTHTTLHLQDYNTSVLCLVTLPNILLTWYNSSHADSYRETTNDPEVAPTISSVEAGELPITAALTSAFLGTLENLNISLRFFAGSWDSFDLTKTDTKNHYDILLTSETIYRIDSLPSLLNLLKNASKGIDAQDTEDHLCLVAAKVLYFGVGGGISDFMKVVEGQGGTVNTVLERNMGVGRRVMKVNWP